MPWPKQTQLIINGQLGLPAKGRAIKELVGLWVLPNLIPRVFGRKRKDLTPLSYPELLDLTLKCHEQQPYSYKVIAPSPYFLVERQRNNL